MSDIYTIYTAKGLFRDTLPEVARWQAEMQGAYAEVEHDGVIVDVSSVDFDSEDIEAAVGHIEHLFKNERDGDGWLVDDGTDIYFARPSGESWLVDSYTEGRSSLEPEPCSLPEGHEPVSREHEQAHWDVYGPVWAAVRRAGL